MAAEVKQKEVRRLRVNGMGGRDKHYLFSFLNERPPSLKPLMIDDAMSECVICSSCRSLSLCSVLLPSS
jgi:hypothetical protein